MHLSSDQSYYAVCSRTFYGPCNYPLAPLKGEDANPPIIATIDYGDGSPALQSSLDNPKNIFQHGYSRPGTYDVSLTGIDVFFLS